MAHIHTVHPDVPLNDVNWFPSKPQSMWLFPHHYSLSIVYHVPIWNMMAHVLLHFHNAKLDMPIQWGQWKYLHLALAELTYCTSLARSCESINKNVDECTLTGKRSALIMLKLCAGMWVWLSHHGTQTFLHWISATSMVCPRRSGGGFPRMLPVGPPVTVHLQLWSIAIYWCLNTYSWYGWARQWTTLPTHTPHLSDEGKERKRTIPRAASMLLMPTLLKCNL